MTCIVATRRGSVITMGGDGAGVAGQRLTRMKAPKVFQNKDFLIGYTHSFRMGQLLQHTFTPPVRKEGQEPIEYLCTDFIEAVRTCFKEGGVNEADKGIDSAGKFLIGWEGHIYTVDSDYQVGESVEPFAAIGSGEELALGAFYGMIHKRSGSKMTPAAECLVALRAAEQFMTTVCPPYTVIDSEGKNHVANP